MDFLGLIVSVVIAALLSGFVIWIVGKLGLGLEVSGFGPAFIAAIVIAVVSGVIYWLLGLFGLAPGGGWLGALISLIIAAVVLMISDRFVAGMKVNGFVGALVAAIAIGVVWWLVSWVLGLFGMVV
jgi:putative membrane protein